MNASEQTNKLIDKFGECLNEFERIHIFSGPSLYFHQKTISLRRSLPKVDEALKDWTFMENLYATLTSWGMQRMGRNNVKLVDLKVMQDSFLKLSQKIESLQYINLLDLKQEDLPLVSSDI